MRWFLLVLSVHMPMTTTISNSVMDCKFNFVCGVAITPLFHFQSQEQLERIYGTETIEHDTKFDLEAYQSFYPGNHNTVALHDFRLALVHLGFVSVRNRLPLPNWIVVTGKKKLQFALGYWYANWDFEGVIKYHKGDKEGAVKLLTFLAKHNLATPVG